MKNKIINKYFIIITQTCLFSTSFYFMVVSPYSTYQEALKRRLEPSPRIFEILDETSKDNQTKTIKLLKKMYK